MSKVTDVGNTIVDTVQRVADNPLIGLLGFVLPQATAVVEIIRRNRAAIDAAQPIITEAVEAGIPVFEKAVEAYPKFAKAVSEILHVMPSPGLSGPSTVVAVENVARLLGGHARMTIEEQSRIMNRMTPGNDPSEENSRYPVG